MGAPDQHAGVSLDAHLLVPHLCFMLPHRFAVAALVLALTCLLTDSTFGEETPPSFVLLMGDDHGWSETGYNGHPFVKTPVLDDMAQRGLRLDHFYSGHPTCSPTRGSFLTGRHPVRYGTFRPNFSIRPEEITIAHILSEAGYRCGHFGKWHLGPVKAESPTGPGAMGFDEYLSHDNFYEMDPVLSRNGAEPEKLSGEGSMVTIDATIDFIDRAKQENKPFLAVVWFGSPHEPYSGLPEDLALYDDLPESLSERTVKLTSMETGKPTKRPLRDVLRERYAEITAMDRAIGKLRDHLSETGLKDNTLLWYCGDNGSPSSSGRATTPFRGEKALMYEGGIRVPGLIEWPAKIKLPRSSSVSSVTSDILPTLCQLTDTAMPERPIDGISLATLINSEMQERSKPICFWQYPVQRVTDANLKPYIDPALQEGTTPLVKYMAGKLTRSFTNYHQPPIEAADFEGARAIIDKNYKLVIDGDKQGSVELFDLNQDPAETTNLKTRYPKVTAALQDKLKAWQDSVLESLQGNDY
jgi:arylsulfatase A-like enzyme